ncbi:MAG: hypothetical protein VXY33_01320 [Verrucomicrobiota bacterium]|nr:hypothetical protein [Verrucomicrobiota bacterium]
MSNKFNSKIPPEITETLGRMRRGVQRYFIVDGLKYILAVLIAIIIADFLIDKTFRMDFYQRLVMLLLGAGCLIFVAFKRLIAPLMSRLSDDALLLELEQSHGGMNESLISALELSRMRVSEGANVSAKMIQETIDTGASQIKDVEISSAFKLKKMKINFYILLILFSCFVVGVFGALTNDSLSIWYKRNVLLQEVQWPSNYVLNVVGLYEDKIRVAKGDDVSIKVKVKEGYKLFPESIVIEFKSEKYNKSEEVLAGRDGVFISSPTGSMENAEFRVLSKEFETPWYPLEIVDRPSLDESISLDVTFPEYTKLKEKTLSADEGPYELIDGSTLKIYGETDKLLNKAFLKIDDLHIDLKIEGSSFNGELNGDNLKTGVYTIHVEDNEKGIFNQTSEMAGLGFNESPKFRLRVINDIKPKLNIKTTGLSGMIVPGAIIPYSGVIDDDFSIELVEIDYLTKEDTGDRRELSGKITPNGIKSKLGSKRIEMDGFVDLAPLDLAVNSRFSLLFSATDKNNITGPNVGRSTKMLFRIVGEAELRTDLLRREKEQRQLITESIKKQDLILTDSGAIAAELTDINELTRENKERMATLQKNQKNLGNDISNVVRALKGMVMEIKNNKLEEDDGVLQSRLNEKVIDPLVILTSQSLPSIAIELDEVRRINDKELRSVKFKAINESQLYVIQTLREVLIHMVRNEGYQQALNLLYEIQRAQERMNKMTTKAKEESLKNVIEEKRSDPVDDKKQTIEK